VCFYVTDLICLWSGLLSHQVDICPLSSFGVLLLLVPPLSFVACLLRNCLLVSSYSSMHCVRSTMLVHEEYWKITSTCDAPQVPYRLVMIGVTVDPHVAAARGIVRKLLTGRAVRISGQLRSHQAYSKFFEQYVELFDEVQLFDNNAAVFQEAAGCNGSASASGSGDWEDEDGYDLGAPLSGEKECRPSTFSEVPPGGEARSSTSSSLARVAQQRQQVRMIAYKYSRRGLLLTHGPSYQRFLVKAHLNTRASAIEELFPDSAHQPCGWSRTLDLLGKRCALTQRRKLIKAWFLRAALQRRQRR
jgi:hypothetical protein